MSNYAYEDVPVALRKDSTGQLYEAGLVVNGAFHRFAQFKVGGFDDRLKKAQSADDPSASQSQG